MSTADHPIATPAVTPAPPRPAPPLANGIAFHTQPRLDLTGGPQPPHLTDTRPAPAPPPSAAMTSKKGKQKKGVDSSETSKLLAARISQLELDAAGEKDQEAEIEREVKKATRELNNNTSRLSDMQKIDYLYRRCSELFADMKRHERDSIKLRKRGDQIQKDKDATRTELSKTTLLKDKLEKLCRELQKENNKLKNEAKTLTDTLTRNQNAWDEKFSNVLQKLDDYQEEKDNPRKQVVDMEMSEFFRQRFKSFIDQYELRELHFHSQMRTKELEVQYNLARFERAKKDLEAEAARSRQLSAQVQNSSSKTEAELRRQLDAYVDQIKQVEETLNSSNDLFQTFHKDMDEMKKKTTRLEKENRILKRKHEALNGNISKMGIEREKYEREMEEWKKKEARLNAINAKLNGIIRQMQEQGRGIQQNLVGTGFEADAEGSPAGQQHSGQQVPGKGSGEGARGEREPQGDDSEYEDEYDEEGEEEEEGSEEGEEEEEEEEEEDEYDEETEDELHQEVVSYGPEPPPPAPATNGHR